MANQVFFPNHGVNAQWGPSQEEIYLQNMHSFNGMNNPPQVQYVRQYTGVKKDYEEYIMHGESQYQSQVMNVPSTQLPQFELASQQNLLGHGFQNLSTCPMRGRVLAPTIDNTLHYFQNNAQHNGYNTQTFNQHWFVTQNPSQGQVHLMQASASHAANSHINVPTPQTMANGAQGSQVMYSMSSCESTSPVAKTCTQTNKTPRRTNVGAVAAESHQAAADIDEIEEFAQNAKKRRIYLGLTQENVGDGLGALHNKAFSQTTICRFEAGQLSISNMRKLKPILSRWFDEIETNEESREIVNRREKPKTTVKRKRRTSFNLNTKQYLEFVYGCCRRPNSKAIKYIATRIGQESKVVRVWFCNQRQKDKREQIRLAKEEASNSPALNENCDMTPMPALQHYPSDLNGSNLMLYLPAFNNEQLF